MPNFSIISIQSFQLADKPWIFSADFGLLSPLDILSGSIYSELSRLLEQRLKCFSWLQ